MLLLAAAAFASDTIDIGVLKNSELRVVQKQLYTKERKLEFGASLGAMMDGFTVAPQLGLVGVYHLSEGVGIEAQLGGGYGLKTGFTTMLEGPAYGVAVEANRYLGGAQVDLQVTPIYAKMNFFGKSIIHYDVYGLVGAGAFVEQSILPAADITVAPTIPLGIGARAWLSPKTLVRLELRDNFAIESFPEEGGVGLIQKPTVSLGISMLSGGSKK